MEKLFNNILVPFALWENADGAVQKAIEMANQIQCHVHILLFMHAHIGEESSGIAHLKKTIHKRYQPRLDPSLSLTICSREGTPEKLIVEYYRKHDIDLILLARTAGAFWKTGRSSFPVNVNRLIKKVQCPVLNVTIDPAASAIKNIVLPVGNVLPVRKLLFATYLAKLSRSTIHLVSAGGKYSGQSGEGMESLQRSYRLLRENTNLPVECRTMPGENLADVALSYAKKIQADLILIGPGKESHLSGFLNALRSRFLFNASLIPVMTVS
jgi:nucleotide-binding universal stress UspA family protein